MKNSFFLILWKNNNEIQFFVLLKWWNWNSMAKFVRKIHIRGNMSWNRELSWLFSLLFYLNAHVKEEWFDTKSAFIWRIFLLLLFQTQCLLFLRELHILQTARFVQNIELVDRFSHEITRDMNKIRFIVQRRKVETQNNRQRFMREVLALQEEKKENQTKLQCNWT